MFDDAYKPILNRIEESDDSMINVVKYNLEKFSRQINQLGTELKQRSDDIKQTVGNISSRTDIKIFMENNCTNNELKKEKY